MNECDLFHQFVFHGLILFFDCLFDFVLFGPEEKHLTPLGLDSYQEETL